MIILKLVTLLLSLNHNFLFFLNKKKFAYYNFIIYLFYFSKPPTFFRFIYLLNTYSIKKNNI